MRAFRRAIRGVDAFLLSRFFLFLALVLRELARLKFRNSKPRGNDRRLYILHQSRSCNTKTIGGNVKKTSKKEFRVDRES